MMQEQAESAFEKTWRFAKLGAGGLLVLFALYLIRPDSEYIQQMERLEQEGRAVTARVTGKIEGSADHASLPPKGGGAVGSFARGFANGQRLSDAMDGRGDGHFYLEYRFNSPKGEQVNGRGIVSPSYFKTVSKGAEVKVIYLPENPTINRLLAYSEPFKRFPQSILLTISAIIGSIGAFLIWWNWPAGTKAAAGADEGDALDRVRGNGRVARAVAASGDFPSRRPQPRSEPRRQGFGRHA